MTAGFSLCLQLGSASSPDVSAYTQVLTATTPAELASSRQGLAPCSLDQLDIVVSAKDLLAGATSLYNPMELANWVPFLKPEQATVAVQVLGEASAAELQPVLTSFLLAGLASASERRQADGSRVLTATRKVVVPTGAAPLKKKNAVTIGLLDDDIDMMIDEDNLLDDDVLAPPPAMGAAAAAGDDCAGRKPCDDCSCGRADAEASSQPTTAPSSSCGKCNLGDAFRCASCPYLGKPAFKSGEEHLVLDLADDF
jgi:hypothetical protein